MQPILIYFLSTAKSHNHSTSCLKVFFRLVVRHMVWNGLVAHRPVVIFFTGLPSTGLMFHPTVLIAYSNSHMTIVVDCWLAMAGWKAVDTSPTSACAQVWCRHATSRVDANPGSRNTGGRFDDAPSTASRSALRTRSVARSRPQCLSATTTFFSSSSWTDGRHVLGSLREKA